MIVDELILKLQADLGDIKKSLAQVEAQGKETGKKTGQGFADAFNAIVGGALAAKVTGFLRSSVTEFNKLEKTLLGLQATAKLTGNSFEALKKSVQTLSSDGVLSIDQASTSMKTLIAQGIQADKAFQLLDAAKKVSSFNNIVGDAGQGVADFVKFLQTGSAELAENMDPSIVKVVKSLGGYAKVSSDATAKQKLINAVIEKGGKLAGDYEKFLNSGAQAQVKFDGASLALSQTLGQKLQPAFTAIVNGITTVLTWVTNLIGKMDGLTVATVAFGTTAFLAIASFSKGAALLPGIFGSIGTAVAGALGPIGLLIAAAGAAFIAFNKLRDAYGKTKGQEMLEERKALEEIGKKQALSISQRERLKQLNAEIAKTYDPILKKLGLENLAFEEQLRLIGAIDRERKKAASGGAENAARSRAALQESIAARRRTLAGFAQTDFSKMTASQSAERLRQIELLGQSLREDEARLASYGDEEAAAGGSMARAAGGGKPSAEFRFIRARDEMANLAKERDAYIRRVGAGTPLAAQAEERFAIEQQAITKQLRGSIAEYIEERYTAEKLALDAQKEEQIKNVRELVNAKAISEKEGEERMQRIREANARKTAMLTAESFARTMQGANMIAGGVGSLVNARDLGGALGGFGGISQGLGALSPKLAALGPIGQGLAAAGGVVSVLSGLFGKSDEQRAREAEAQKRRDEEAKALLELQANYQRSMLALQEAAARLPFENLSRQLRLIDINAQSQRVGGGNEAAIEQQRIAARQAAIQGVLTQEASTIGGGQLFAGTEATPAGLTQFLNERAAQALAIQQFSQRISALSDPSISIAMAKALAGQALSYRGKIPDELFNAVSNTLSGIMGIDIDSFFTGTISELQQLRGGIDQGGMLATTFRDTADRIRAASNIFSGVSGASSLAESLVSEITRDTTTAENLLSVIEQSQQTQLEINANTKKTADNTSQLLRPDRQRNWIDVGQGFISSLGQRISPSGVGIARSLSQQGLSLPSEIGLASTTSTLAKTLQERMAEAMEMQVRNGARANDLLSGILRATIELYRVMDGNPSTVSGFDNAAADAWLADRERRRF